MLLTVASGGTGDDTAAIHAQRDAAAAAGVGLRFPAGVYRTTGITLNSSMRVEFDPGAVIQKVDDAASPAVTIAGGIIVEVAGAEIDGNRAAGATGPNIAVKSGATAILRDINTHHAKTQGVLVTGSGSKAYCYRVTSNDHDGGFGTSGNGDGFFAQAGGYLWADDHCTAARNARSGFFLLEGAADGCRVGGYTTGNGLAGFQLRSDNGYGDTLICEDNGCYGVLMGRGAGATVGWVIASITTRRQGVSIKNGAGSGVELLGAQHNRFGLIVNDGDLGYGTALAKSGDSTPSKFNTIAQHVGKSLSDPSLHFSGGASHNHVGSTHSYGVGSVAVILGESTAGNDYNTIGTVVAEGCRFGALRIDGGANNTVDRVTARDTYTTDATRPGVITFTGSTTTGNYVGRLECSASGVAPKYGIYADSRAAGNTVAGSRIADFQLAAISDASKKNQFH